MFSYPDASRFLGVHGELLSPSAQAIGASIDTRTLQPGNLFVALAGTNVDGHQFLEEAFRKGASGAVIQKSIFENHRARFLDSPFLFRNLLPVPDPQKALTDLACWHRSKISVKAVGITGSVGKTSTKEFLHYLLQKKFSVLATAGNFNNHLGLPLTLLRLRAEDQFCVAELGASHVGEIKRLAEILKPAGGIITQISPAHLEGFDSVEKIYQAKLELFEVLAPDSPAVFPDGDSILASAAECLKLKGIRVGQSPLADYRISEIRTENSFVHFTVNEKWHFSFPGIAAFLSRNAAMAIAMAEALGMPMKDIPEVWADLELPKGRFQEKILGDGIRLIDDGYNANPASFEKAIETFAALEVSGKKILVFSDMLELGSEETHYHEDLGRKIAGCHFDYAAAYGPRSRRSIEILQGEISAAAGDHFDSPEELAAALSQRICPGDAVLFKASRGMKIEKVFQFLEANQSGAPFKPARAIN